MSFRGDERGRDIKGKGVIHMQNNKTNWADLEILSTVGAGDVLQLWITCFYMDNALGLIPSTKNSYYSKSVVILILITCQNKNRQYRARKVAQRGRVHAL